MKEIMIRVKLPAKKYVGLMKDQMVPSNILQNFDTIKETIKASNSIPKRVIAELANVAATINPITVETIFATIIE